MLEKVWRRTSVGKRFFSSRVSDSWNALPESCVLAPTLNGFKSELNTFFDGFPLKFDHRVRTARFTNFRNGWSDGVVEWARPRAAWRPALNSSEYILAK